MLNLVGNYWLILLEIRIRYIGGYLSIFQLLNL